MIRFRQILKWNELHYGAGDHGGQFRPRNLDFSDKNFDDDVDPDVARAERSMSPAKAGGASREYEVPTKIYTSDPHNLSYAFKQLENDGCSLSASPEVMATKWKNLFPNVHPHEVMRAYLGKEGMNNKNMGNMTLHINSKDKKFSFGSTGELEIHGKKVIDYQRTIDMKNKIVDHSVLKLSDEAQGGGVVKKLFGDLLPLYDKLKLTHIRLWANIDRGGYAWGKYGFQYHNDEERVKHQEQIKSVLKAFTDKHSKVKLNPAAVKEKAVLEKALRGKKLDTVWAITDLKTPELDKAYASQIHDDSTKSTFIKMMLKNTKWSGLMDIQKGSPSRDRVNKYVS